ncbi:MAG: heme lyase CcmF/NrfE family subunit [Pseudomonadota bacterium]
MIAELGHFALVLALFTALAQSVVPLVGAQRGWADYMRVGDGAALLQFALLGAAFVALTHAFLTSDFSVRLVASHSHSLKPLIYKISGVWGNHEGSMLLWVLILALFGAMIVVFGRSLPLALKARTLAVQGMIGVAFIAFILFTSNPFERLMPAPVDGRDLNPLLQDPALAIHPPFLYLGYVGLSTSFSFAVAALIEGRVDAAWARWVRPWTLAAWMFLTIGILLGSYWAYYELGWGGWWFWDPVENASFMPWLAATALLHSAIVVEKRGELKSWTILLAILAFSLSLLGTFIVRSGLLTSVHAFATDPSRGVVILAILAVSVGGALWLYSARAHKLGSDGVFTLVSRESALLLNNVLLAAATAAVFIGTMAPLVYEAFGATITVGPPWFDWVFGLLMVPLILVLPIGASLPWKRGDAAKALSNLWVAAVIAFVVGAVVWALQTGASPLGPLGLTLGLWLVLGAFWELGERAKLGRALRGRIPFSESARRFIGIPRAEWGKNLAHAGLGLLALGAVLVTAWESEDVRLVQPGESFEVGGYVLTLDRMERVQGPNYVADRAVMTARPVDGGAETILTPEKRFFPAANTTTTEAAIRERLSGDVYVVIGDRRPNGAWSVRTYIKPWVNWIFIGAGLMAVGGIVSLTDRRHRVGAPAARRRADAVVTPAE